MTRGLHPCETLHCRRKVRTAAAFCCGPCAHAAKGNYELDAHSPGCEERASARGLYGPTDLPL